MSKKKCSSLRHITIIATVLTLQTLRSWAVTLLSFWSRIAAAHGQPMLVNILETQLKENEKC